MKLFLLGYNQYDNIFESYAKVANPSSKYALAQLMGNIKLVESRNILIALLDDKHSIVQGEVVRQLRNEAADVGWTIKGEDQFKDGEVAIYFILFGLISILIMLVQTRKKVDQMSDEIDRVFSNAR